jgi:hypothetical protein
LRLTLRTLLAYIDDTLEPGQAKVIGQKVAESETAQELIERIRQVTRRRRLTTPPPGGPGGIIDPNTLAEYLDNEVTPEQAAEVEQICLASDVHLAEVAACHQILTLILGEPVRAPEEAHARMYGLVKGAGAARSHKPAARAKAAGEAFTESGEIDDTLRLGIPPLRRKSGWRHPLILVGGGLVASALLILAIFQILRLPEAGEGERKDVVAQADNKGKSDGDGTEPGKTVIPDKQPDEGKGSADASAKDKGASEKKDSAVDSADAAADKRVPYGPPNTRSAPIGHYVPQEPDTNILLQSYPDTKFLWKRLTVKQPEVLSTRQLVSLPGSRCDVDTNRGVRVTLWGNVPEFTPVPPIFESVVELYPHDDLDLDMRLERGRVVLTSTWKGKPLTVRLRFDNPMMLTEKDAAGREEYFDITLDGQGSSLLVDRWSTFLPTEPFYKNPKNPSRIGPSADMGCMVLAGKVFFRTGDSKYTMLPPPGSALMIWSSLKSTTGPFALPALPDFAKGTPPLLPGQDPKARKDVNQARGYLANQLAKGAAIDVVLAQATNSDDAATRRLAARSLGAISDLPSLVEALDQPKFADLRWAAIETLHNWVATGRDNDYKLFEVLKAKYKNKEAEIIMEMVHGLPEAESRRPERYEQLIDYLVNPNLVIRELGALQLYKWVPAGRGIPYSAAADSATRERSELLWRALIPPGQLPPAAPPAQPQKK